MWRIYFLVPDINITKQIVNELIQTGVEERHIHLIAKRGTPLEELSEAKLLQKSDFVPAVEKGLAIGGSTGLLVGLIAIALPPFSTVIAGGILLVDALSGAADVGSWIRGMIGTDVSDQRIKEFEEAIEAGKLLVLADVPSERVDEIEARIKQHLPQVEIGGTEPKPPTFS